jgi:hypothetical protein
VAKTKLHDNINDVCLVEAFILMDKPTLLLNVPMDNKSTLSSPYFIPMFAMAQYSSRLLLHLNLLVTNTWALPY